MSTTHASESAELKELKAQVRALQSEVSHLRSKGTGTRHSAHEEARTVRQTERRHSEEREIGDKLRDILDKRDAESSRMIRAVATGSLEHLQLWAEEVSDFTRRVNERNRPTGDDSAEDVNRRLGRETASELLDSIRRSLDFPRQSLDRMRKSYDETEDLQPETKWRDTRFRTETTTVHATPDVQAATVVETTETQS